MVAPHGPLAGVFARDPLALVRRHLGAARGARPRRAEVPELASLVQWAEGNQLVRLLCSARTGFPNVSVTVANTYRALTVKKFAASNVAELRHLPSLVGTPVITEVTLPAGESYEVTFAETSQGTRFDEQEYFLRHSNRAYVIAYTVVDPPDTATLATLTQSIRSFAFTKP